MSRRASDRGVTLLELLVTIVLMGLAFTAVFGGMGLFLRTESVQRSNARIDTELRTYAESVLGMPYVECAAAGSYAAVAAPKGLTPRVTVAYWNGDLPAVYTSACSTDLGLQQITIVLTGTDGVSGTLVVGKSR